MTLNSMAVHSMPVHSMTGFATVQGTLASGRVFGLTLKGVNHRHLDLLIRVPAGMDALEATLRSHVKAAVQRGHLELTLSLEKASAATVVELDESLLDAYIRSFERAAQRFGQAQPLDVNALLRMPGVLQATLIPTNLGEVEAPALQGIAELLTRFNEARAAEGAALAADLRAGMQSLATLTEEARSLREGVTAAEFTRLKLKLQDLLGNTAVPEEKLLTEAALIAARGDIDEELVRLRTHIDRFTSILTTGGETGRQLDFLLQEMNREANTLLSKSGGSTLGLRLTDLGVEIKVLLERAREQVQNLE